MRENPPVTDSSIRTETLETSIESNLEHLDHFSPIDLAGLIHPNKDAQGYTFNHYCSIDAGDIYLLLTFILWCLDTVFVCLILHRQLNEVVISALTERCDVSGAKSVTKQLI